MARNGSKIKIKVYKGRWLRVALPALSFKFFKRICRLGLKFSGKESNMLVEDIDYKELLEEFDLLLDHLSEFEPFVLVEVSEETEKIYVKIETV